MSYARHIRKYVLIGIAFFSLSVALTSTWIEYEETWGSDTRWDYFQENRLTVVESLDEREISMIECWKNCTEPLYGGNSDVYEPFSIDNDDLANHADKTAATKERTKNMLIASIVLMVLTLMISNVKLHRYCWATAGILILVTCAQFAFTYHPQDSSEHQMYGSSGVDLGTTESCESVESSGIPNIWYNANGTGCYDINGGGSEWFELKIRPGLGFYASFIAGLALIPVYSNTKIMSAEEE